MWKLVIEKAEEETNSNCFALMFSGGRGRDVGFQLKVSLSETCARFEGLRLHLMQGQRVAIYCLCVWRRIKSFKCSDWRTPKW